MPPKPGAVDRAAFVTSSFLCTRPAVDILAVCFVLAILVCDYVL